MQRKDGLPYIWPSWLAKLIGGDNQCLWASWVKARFWYRKRRDDNENTLSNWKADHAKLVKATAEELRKDGWTVYVEDQNKFEIKGKFAVMGGKPDIVAVKDTVVLVVDGKTGRPSDADFWQVVIYCHLLPKQFPGICSGRTITGQVRYRSGTPRTISPSDVLASWPKVPEFIDTVVSDVEPPKTPSARECRFCDVDECTARVVPNVTTPTVETDDF